MNVILKGAYFAWFMYRANWRSARTDVERVNLLTGRSRTHLWFDLIGCAFWHGAVFEDYFALRFHEKTAKERRTYITFREWRHHRKRVNRETHVLLFRDKAFFAKRFGKYFRRETCDLRTMPRTEALAWLERRDAVVGKWPLGLQGRGIVKVAVRSIGGAEMAWKYLSDVKATFVEEVIEQHPAVARFHPGSVNTVRVITVRQRDEVTVMSARFGMGNGGLADNIPAGGVAAPVDLASGRLGMVHRLGETELLQCHPGTGVRVEGAILPNWPAVLELAVEAAKVVPEVRSVGWDIAILPDGACLVEGNDNWGHAFPQIVAGRGLKAFIEPE